MKDKSFNNDLMNSYNYIRQLLLQSRLYTIISLHYGLRPQLYAFTPSYHDCYAYCRSWPLLPTYYPITILDNNELLLYNMNWLYIFDWLIDWLREYTHYYHRYVTWLPSRHASRLFVHACPCVDYMFRALKLTTKICISAKLLHVL